MSGSEPLAPFPEPTKARGRALAGGIRTGRRASTQILLQRALPAAVRGGGRVPQSVWSSRPQASETQRASLRSWSERKQLRDGDPLTKLFHFTTTDLGSGSLERIFLDSVKLSWLLGRG